MTIHYNDNAARFIRARRLDNKSYDEIKKDLEITYPEYSRLDVSTIRRNYLTWCAYNDLEDSGVTKKHVDRWVPRQKKEDDRYYFVDNDNKQKDPRRASLLHLLDLKRAGRKFIGTELKGSYYDQAVKNLREMEERTSAGGLFDIPSAAA